MNPRLAAVTGPLRGKTFPLIEEEISVGREPSNRLQISDSSVSRQHCLIKREAEQFKIIDLNSHNGTLVDGVPVRERLLQHGNAIKIGDTIFLFLLYESESSPSSS